MGNLNSFTTIFCLSSRDNFFMWLMLRIKGNNVKVVKEKSNICWDGKLSVLKSMSFLILLSCMCIQGFPGGASGKEPDCQCRRHKRLGFDPWVGKIPWGGHGSPLQCSCLENPRGQRSLAGCSPRGRRVGLDLASPTKCCWLSSNFLPVFLTYLWIPLETYFCLSVSIPFV